jgi:GNAT superfamily N-acetyltransferase
MISDFNVALDIVKKVLTADFACEERHFDEEGVFICRAREILGRRRFPLPEKFLAVVTMGRGVVVSCSAGRLRWAKANLSGLSRDNLFSPYVISRIQKYVARHNQNIHLDLKFICTADTFKPFASGGEIKLRLLEGEKLRGLSDKERFPNALGYAYNPQRPRMAAVVASYRGETVGIAAAAADCDVMWQIGVDTLPQYRDQGIAKTIVSTLTENLFERGILPYYSTRAVNIASQRTALSLGYRPTWIELYSREIQHDAPHPEDSSS